MTDEVIAKRPRGRPRKNPITDSPLTDINKANSEALAVSRLKLGQVGTAALQSIKDEAERAKVRELRWPTCIHTYETMRNDPTVATALALKQQALERAFSKFYIDFNKTSTKSKEAADFIKYNFSNLQNQTLRQIASTASDFNVYGFSCFEKVFTKINNGKYLDKYQYKLNKLAHRPQATLDYREPFKFSQEGREVIGIWQNPNAFEDNYGMVFFDWMKNIDPSGTGAVFIDIKKVTMFNLNATESNPMGRSPLIACYKPFREKVVIENLEVVGVTKELGGVLELKIPSSILQKAALNPSGQESVFLKQLMTDAANAHKGEQSYFILPSDVQPGNSPQYSMDLKGVEGGSSKNNTTTLINERKKLILDVFGAGFVNLGQEGVGSYALSEGKQSLHSRFVERDVDIIEEVFNKDIIPQLLALNGIYLSDEDIPKLHAGEIDQIDVGVFSSAMQRLKATGLIAVTVDMINEIYEKIGLEYRVPENTTQEELMQLLGPMTSRSGDSFDTKTGGLSGTSDSLDTKDNSVSNMSRHTS